MTDLRHQLARLLDDEPAAPYDIDRIMRSGRRARRRRTVVLAAAGTAGAAGLTAAVAIPVLAMGGNNGSVSLGVQPSLSTSPSPSTSPPAKAAHCFLVAARPKAVKHAVARLVATGKVGAHPDVRRATGAKADGRTVLEVCKRGTAPSALQPAKNQDAQPPSGPHYDYTEQPAAIASRLGAQLHDRVSGFGLSVTFTSPFSQESSTLEAGRPAYFGGNVDVHEADGYADIGVQVRHAATELVPFTGDCTAADHCTETTLSDGSVLRTGQVDAGHGDVILTADVHRPDGVIVHAQESNYPFGPDAGSQPHGSQPLTLDELVTLAEDGAFTF